MALGRYIEAIQMFTNYLKKNKNSYEVYFKRAVCYYNARKYKKALYDLCFIIQELKEKENKKKKNEDITNDITDKNKRRSVYIKKKESNIYEDSDNEEKIRSKKNIEEENEEEVWAEIYFLRCKAYINLNQIDSALKDINTFFELIEKEKNKIREEISKTNKNINDFDIEKIIFKKYDISEAHAKKGYCYLVLLDYKSAATEFEKAIKLDPLYTTAYFNMGICLYNLNQKKDAIYYYQKVFNSCHSDIEAFLNLVKCYRETGSPEISYDLLIKNMPLYINKENNYLTKIPKLYYETGMSLLIMEKYEEALTNFKKSIDFEINKNKKSNIELLSECYSKEGFCLSEINKAKGARNEPESKTE